MKRLICLATLICACTDLPTPPPTGNTVVALFDPKANPPVVPQPTDLAYQGGDGIHLHVPIPTAASPAEKEFLTWLNTLDGFPGTLDQLDALVFVENSGGDHLHKLVRTQRT